jgi:hypothetical protein
MSPVLRRWTFACTSPVCCSFNCIAQGSRGLSLREEQHLEAAQMKFLRHLLGIAKLDKEKNQCIREKTGAQNIVKQKSGYNTYRGWTQIDYQN